jgi:NAD kinase
VTTADVEGCDIIVAAGGDGTFLKTASRISKDIPVVGEPRLHLEVELPVEVQVAAEASTQSGS